MVNYNQAMIDFFEDEREFRYHVLKVELAKSLEEVRKAKEFILNRKMSVLGKEIYKMESEVKEGIYKGARWEGGWWEWN